MAEYPESKKGDLSGPYPVYITKVLCVCEYPTRADAPEWAKAEKKDGQFWPHILSMLVFSASDKRIWVGRMYWVGENVWEWTLAMGKAPIGQVRLNEKGEVIP